MIASMVCPTMITSMVSCVLRFLPCPALGSALFLATVPESRLLVSEGCVWFLIQPFWSPNQSFWFPNQSVGFLDQPFRFPIQPFWFPNHGWFLIQLFWLLIQSFFRRTDGR